MMFRAYTLIEVLLVVGIFTAMALITMPYSINLLQSGRGEDNTKNMVSNMFKQQQDAFSGQSNSAYGISFYSDHYVLYQGASLAGATDTLSINFDRSVTISNISLTGGAIEVNFSKNSLKPSKSGSVTVSDSVNTYLVTINAEGLLSYNKQ
jgi:type II secretory pathway pseudopilin PulG